MKISIALERPFKSAINTMAGNVNLCRESQSSSAYLQMDTLKT